MPTLDYRIIRIPERWNWKKYTMLSKTANAVRDQTSAAQGITPRIIWNIFIHFLALSFNSVCNFFSDSSGPVRVLIPSYRSPRHCMHWPMPMWPIQKVTRLTHWPMTHRPACSDRQSDSMRTCYTIQANSDTTMQIALLRKIVNPLKSKRVSLKNKVSIGYSCACRVRFGGEGVGGSTLPMILFDPRVSVDLSS